MSIYWQFSFLKANKKTYSRSYTVLSYKTSQSDINFLVRTIYKNVFWEEILKNVLEIVILDMGVNTDWANAAQIHKWVKYSKFPGVLSVKIVKIFEK